MYHYNLFPANINQQKRNYFNNFTELKYCDLIIHQFNSIYSDTGNDYTLLNVFVI